MPAAATLPDPVRVTRRRVLGAGAAVGSAALGASACDLAVGPEEGAAPVPTKGPGTAVAADPTPDQRLLAGVAEDIATAAAVVRGARRGRPALRRSLRGLTRLHRAHLAELPVDVAGGGDRVRVAGDDARALQQVRSAEQRLQRRLADAAVAAESGSLAALLASMSAAVAQQLASGGPS